MLCLIVGGLTLLTQISFGGSLQQTMAALRTEMPIVGDLFVVMFFMISNYIFMKTFVAMHVLNFNLLEEEKVLLQKYFLRLFLKHKHIQRSSNTWIDMCIEMCIDIYRTGSNFGGTFD